MSIQCIVLGMFKKDYQLHDYGHPLGTIPDVQRCKRCGKYSIIPGTQGPILDDNGAASILDLPKDIRTNMADAYCTAVPIYTQYQYDQAKTDAYRGGYVSGQESALTLQPEFSRQFFSKIRLNPNTLVYEIPYESYQLLKNMITREEPEHGNA